MTNLISKLWTRLRGSIQGSRPQSQTHALSLMLDTSGNATIFFSLSAVVIIGCAGLAVDYGRVQMKRSSMQSNLDAAVLAGVSGTLVPNKQILTAQAFFDRFTHGEESKYDVVFSIKSGRLIGAATTTVPTSLLRVLKIDHVKIESKRDRKSVV